MAVTAIWKVDSRLDQVINYTTNEKKTKNDFYEIDYKELHNLIEYAGAEYKTENQYYVSGINCLKETAYKEMAITKKQYLKTDGIQAFHIIQSFKEGEVTPELAHKIGVELAEELFGDRFEVLVSTHLNTKHYHNHIVINSVSFKDGKRYYDNNTTYAILRKTSDLICEEYGLSIIDENKISFKKINYEKIYNGKVVNSNYYVTTKEDVDKAIKQANSFEDFQNIMKAMDYEMFFRANKISVRRYPYKRNIRIERAFGENYSINNIKTRIFEEYETRVPFIEEYSRKYKRYKGKKLINKNKAKGVYRLYLHYFYLLKIFPKKNYKQYIPPSIREDIKKMDRISDESKLLCSNKITTIEQLFLYRKELSNELANLKCQREDTYRLLRKENIPNEIEIREQIFILSQKIRIIKREELMCEEILERVPQMKANIKEMFDLEEKKLKNNEGGKCKDEYIK